VPDDRWTTWQAEQSGTNWQPSIRATFLLFAVLTVVLLAMLGGPDAVAEWSGSDRLDGTSLCEQHAGRPGWDAVCAEGARR
jgi:hypothetical protein